LHDILYQPPYRKGTVEETDGFFTFRGFDYLLEARWRKTQPPVADLRAFSGKVKAKIESTRGLFLSIPGFRDEVVTEAATLSNLILMDGQELALILEGRVSLVEGLQIKLDNAAQKGLLYYSQLTSEERAAARYADAYTKANVLRESVRTRAGTDRPSHPLHRRRRANDSALATRRNGLRRPLHERFHRNAVVANGCISGVTELAGSSPGFTYYEVEIR
jgi:hypothetical protein